MTRLSIKTLYNKWTLSIGTFTASIWTSFEKYGNIIPFLNTNIDSVFIKIGISILISILLALLVFFARDFFNKNDHCYSHIDEKIIQRNFNQTKEIRIFCSSGNTYKSILLNILNKNTIYTRLRIKILMRDDNSESRKNTLETSKQQWQSDIQNKYRVDIEYKKIKSPIMLRGIILNDTLALLGWYLRINDSRIGQDTPLFIVEGDSENSKKIIEDAIETFDSIFENAQDV